MADGLWGAFFRRLGKNKCLAERIKLVRQAKNGTGLTRLDQYNWIDEVASMSSEIGADLFVGSFGVNDRQTIVDTSKARVEYGSPEFDAHYKVNVINLVEAAVSHGASMLILGLPVMRDPAVNADADAKNRLFAAGVAEANSPRASYARPWTSQSGRDEYKPYLPNGSNVMVPVRAPDGIHFTAFGYELVFDNFYPAILASLKQRGRDIQGECIAQVEAR
jgi:hypothetical protein